jgi:hypothetical protein
MVKRPKTEFEPVTFKHPSIGCFFLLYAHNKDREAPLRRPSCSAFFFKQKKASDFSQELIEREQPNSSHLTWDSASSQATEKKKKRDGLKKKGYNPLSLC